jgi:hypothetical protein
VQEKTSILCFYTTLQIIRKCSFQYRLKKEKRLKISKIFNPANSTGTSDIPDPRTGFYHPGSGFFHPGPGSATLNWTDKEFKYFLIPKTVTKRSKALGNMIRGVYPGSGFFSIPGSGSRGKKSTGSRIRNTVRNDEDLPVAIMRIKPKTQARKNWRQKNPSDQPANSAKANYFL